MLVVIFVLGVGLIGALSFFNINLNNQFEAKQELIAAGLAQEGADLVRNIVDYNYLNNKPTWYNEIAEELGEPLGTIKSRIHFARKILKQKIVRY